MEETKEKNEEQKEESKEESKDEKMKSEEEPKIEIQEGEQKTKLKVQEPVLPVQPGDSPMLSVGSEKGEEPKFSQASE